MPAGSVFARGAIGGTVRAVLFDDGKLKAAGFSAKQIEKLRQRQRGGTSGQRGYTYQRRYALLRALELAFSNLQARLQMEALCPVDDVVVTEANRFEFAQCKVSDTETWGGNDNKLAKEFRDQRRLLMKSGIAEANISLKLVVADDTQQVRLAKNTPATMKLCTTVEHFPLPIPEHHPWQVKRLADALDALLPPVLRGVSMREELFKELLHAAGEPWQSATVEELLDAAGRRTDLPLAYPRAKPRSVTPQLWAQAEAILAAIPGLSIDLAGGVCCYSAPPESGFVARCDTARFARFVNDVIATRPRTMDAFLEVRPT